MPLFQRNRKRAVGGSWITRGVVAFSLVEVVLAVGIVSFAMLTMVALLPLGLSTFRTSMDTYLSSQTRRDIINNLQQSNPTNLFSGGGAGGVYPSYGETDYFDDEGILLQRTSSTGTSYNSGSTETPVYQVAVTVAPNNPNNANMSAVNLPGSGSNPTNLVNAALITTLFSHYGVNAANVPTTSAFRTNTDYIYFQSQ